MIKNGLSLIQRSGGIHYMKMNLALKHILIFKNMTKRIQTIDYLRAITMLLMIFVNDFWTLKNIPNWLKHAPAILMGWGFLI